MTAQLHLEQGSPEWLESRKHYIGASEASIILGISPYRTAYQLWQEKLGLIEPQKTTPAMTRGNVLEEPARQQFEAMTSLIVPPAMVYHPDYDFIRASLDGITFCGRYIVEIKCVNKIDHQTALDGKIPEKYYCQVQMQLACAPNAEFAYYFSYDEANPFKSAIVKVDRDNKFIDDLIPKLVKFWDNVLHQKAPEMSEKDFIQIESMNGSFSEEWNQISKEYKDVSTQLKQLKDQESQLKERLLFLSSGRNVVGHGIKVSNYFMTGRVKYADIPEIKNLDLERYRSKPTKCCRITIIEL